MISPTFEISQHCKQRYAERIDWNGADRLSEMLANAKDITDEIFDKYPSYMLFLKQKYKKSNKLFKVNNVLFICRMGRPNRIIAVTCYPITEFTFKKYESSKSKKEIYFELAKLKLQKG